MHAMLLRLLVLALLPALGGCLMGTAQSRVTSDYAAQVKQVGVISVLSSLPNISFLSTSAMDSHFAAAMLDGWDVDRVAYGRLVPRLQHKGYTVKILPRTGALAAAQQSDWRLPLADSIENAAYAAGKAAGVDMVVVVEAQVEDDFVTHTNQRVRGYGLQRAFDTGPFVYATVMVGAFDVEREFVVGRADGAMVKAADDSLWDTDYEQRGGPIKVAPPTASALLEQLEQVLGDVIGVAAQEAGL